MKASGRIRTHGVAQGGEVVVVEVEVVVEVGAGEVDVVVVGGGGRDVVVVGGRATGGVAGGTGVGTAKLHIAAAQSVGVVAITT